MGIKIDMDEPVEAIRDDSPTQSRAAAAPATAQVAAPSRRIRARRPAKTPAAPKAAAAPSIDVALASAQTPVATRQARELWELATARAEELGFPVRLLFTDALVRALEQDSATHSEHLAQTRKREKYATADAA